MLTEEQYIEALAIADACKKAKIDKDLKWHKRHLEMAQFCSKRSKDPRKQVGAVITENNKVRGTGYNGFPTGIEDTEYRLSNRDLKNAIMVHAEINAILTADGKGDTVYVYPCLPCTQCLGALIQYGIKTVVTQPIDYDSSWNFDLVMELAKEARITVIEVEL